MIDKNKLPYTKIIQEIIDDNKKYYCFDNQLQWEYFSDSDKANFAYNNNYVLFLNTASIEYAIEMNQPLMIELYILHEIRHIYQRMNVALYRKEPKTYYTPINAQMDYELSNYVSPAFGLEIYYSQYVETDAFAFSHAVIAHKYGKLPEYIVPPQFYLTNDLYQSLFNGYLNIFTAQLSYA